MKKIFLLLTIIFSQAQVSFTNSEDLTSQVIAEKQDLAKDKKSQTWREYCDKKVASAKEKLNNGYQWVKRNPKITAALIVLNEPAICALAYLVISYKSSSAKLRIEKEKLISRIKEQNVLIYKLKEASKILLKENEQLRAGEFPWLLRNN